MSSIESTQTIRIGQGDGELISIETGKLAKQADGSVVIRAGKCMLLATVVASKEVKEGVDFLPLSVDYQEKYAAIGRIPGSFLRRESRLSDYEILICRLVDRALRPLFPKDYHADVQVMISLISSDPAIQPDTLAALAASAALAVSDIPFAGPIAAVRVGRIEGEYRINPSLAEMEKADMDILLAGSIADIVMMEGEMKECSEADMVKAIQIGHEAIKIQVQGQLDLVQQLGGKPKRSYSHEQHNPVLKAQIEAALTSKIAEITSLGLAKTERADRLKTLKTDFIAEYDLANPDQMLGQADLLLVNRYYHDIEKTVMRQSILEKGIRLDGRETESIRQICSEVAYLPAAHGSALFTRGETQSLTTVTLGAKSDEQLIDGVTVSGYNRFMLHYNFPGFSTGEVRPNRGVGRREVGHGNLAMRSLRQVLPPDIPYTLRIVSDILESNGSSSMATVCAGTLALMDAGIQISAPVSGIAMGLISDPKAGKFAILSDISGEEDHLGDMDFKVTGTTKGICACQMDIKIQGLPYEILEKALAQARNGRLHILSEMDKTLKQPHPKLKPHAPRVLTMTIPRELIGAVIGPGGKVIQEMQRRTGAIVNIEEEGEEGKIQIFADNDEAASSCLQQIKDITAVPEIGKTYSGVVKKIVEFGAFVEFMPGKDGLVHISEVSHARINSLEELMAVIAEGDRFDVKLLEVDKRTGKFRLSKKVLIPIK